MKTLSVKQPGNSRPFQPGDARINRHGRPPKVKCIADILRRIGNEKLPADVRAQMRDTLPTSATFLEAVCRQTMLAALCGNAWAVEFIAERTEGRVIQAVDLTARRGRPSIEDLTDEELKAEIERMDRVEAERKQFERPSAHDALTAQNAEKTEGKEK